MTELPLLPYEELEGVLETITFANEENGYTVARLGKKGNKSSITIVGVMPGIQVGETLRVKGIWTTHNQYGRQFEVEKYQVKPPETTEAIARYLSSGLLKGVGTVTAQRITDYFGEKSLEILDCSPERLIEIPKIGRKRAQMIAVSWREQRYIKDIMMFLQQYGVGVSLAVKIYRQYGDGAIELVKANPYQLIHDIQGVGFVTADRIALEMGLLADSPARIQAGLGYTLETMSQEGHCFAERSELVIGCSKLLQVPEENCSRQIDLLLEKKYLLGSGEAIYLPYFYNAEQAVAENLLRLIKTSRDRMGLFVTANWDQAAEWLQQSDKIRLTIEQMSAIQMAVSNKVSILTGGPGTGKSTITGNLIRLLLSFGLSVLLTAPTGRAAKRLSEATGLEAATIHRLLEYTPTNHGFKRNRKHPLNTDLIIVDEASMIDILLMHALLDAVSDGTHVLFIGDQDQLPSVGAGNVLKDMIESEVIPVKRLTQIFRQSEDSFIIENTHRINRGDLPEFSEKANDFFLFNMESAEKVEEWIVDIVTNRLKNKFGISAKEVQVLSPMYRGPAGVSSLNQRLQQAINPVKARGIEFRSGERLLRVGDRVMQLRNNYDKLVFNGDIGNVVNIDLEEQHLEVDFEGRTVSYEFTQTDELQLAYAISIHKSQGSEFPVVVLPLLTHHYIMLQRNLLYTAVSRARKMVVMVGSKKAIGMAVRNNQTATRNTRLCQLLKTS